MCNQRKDWPRSWPRMALWAVGMLWLGSPARAGSIVFNPTGSAASPATAISGIDIAPGNALAHSSLPLTVGATFQLDFQATIDGVINTNGLTVTPSGLSTSYQLTALASYTEVVTYVSADHTVATFGLAPTQASNSFFDLYYNSSVVANNLQGTGFNAGTLILAGTPTATGAGVGIFSLSTNASGPILSQFDQFGTNNYGGLQTVSGSGSSLVTANVTYENPNFFLTPISQITFNSSLVTPFSEVDPSAKFTDKSGVGVAPDVVPNLGPVNGLGLSGGVDFQFEADPNMSFTVGTQATPEPASLILAGLGLLGVLGLRARMKP